jgi:DNA modification methylase
MGSGSTLLAAHLEGRVGYGMEISPRYVDTICRRIERHTKIVPVLESTGEAHSFAKDD